MTVHSYLNHNFIAYFITCLLVDFQKLHTFYQIIKIKKKIYKVEVLFFPILIYGSINRLPRYLSILSTYILKLYKEINGKSDYIFPLTIFFFLMLEKYHFNSDSISNTFLFTFLITPSRRIQIHIISR